MKRIATIIATVVVLAGLSTTAMATPCVEGDTNSNQKVHLTDLEAVGGSQYTLTFANWPIVTASANGCGSAIQLDTAVVATVDGVTWLETGTTNVVANLGAGWTSNANVGAGAEAVSPSNGTEAWFGFLNTSGGSAPAGEADLRVTLTLQPGVSAGDLLNALDHTGGRRFLFTDQTNLTGSPQDVGQTQASIGAADIAGTKDQRACTGVIAKGASKYISAKSKALQKCENERIRGHYLGICPDPFEFPGSPGRAAADSIAKAALSLERGIGKKCGGQDKACGGNTATEVGGGLAGRLSTCNDFAASGCTNAIDVFECSGIAACIECVGNVAVDQTISVSYADLEPSVGNDDLNKCQQAIGKSVAKYLQAKDKALLKCWYPRLNGATNFATCPDTTAPSGSAPKKAAISIAKAEAKKITTICKACGGEEKLCDTVVPTVNPGTPAVGGSGGTGADADFTADDILVGAGPFTCPSVTVPPAPGRPALACGGPIATLADLIFCLDCVAEYNVDCADANRLPETILPYPTECN